MARWAAMSRSDAPPGWVTRTPVTLPSGRIVNVTPTGWVKPDRICWFQSIQIFCWTPARYQSPPESVPSGTPGPGGPNSSPGVAEAVPRPPGTPPGVTAGVVARLDEGTGGGVRAFFGARRASGSGSAFG